MGQLTRTNGRGLLIFNPLCLPRDIVALISAPLNNFEKLVNYDNHEFVPSLFGSVRRRVVLGS